MSAIEIIATAFGLACVILTIPRHMLLWPTGLIQVVLYVYVFAKERLYSETILHVIYTVMQIYGWYHWTRGRTDRQERLPIMRLPPQAIFTWLLASLALAGGWGFVMKRFTNASLPYLDATVFALSIAAQFLLCRKILETWLFWIAVDVLAIYVFYAKHLYVTAGLYAVFLVLAIIGFRQWLKTYRNQATGSATASSSESSSPRTAATSS